MRRFSRVILLISLPVTLLVTPSTASASRTTGASGAISAHVRRPLQHDRRLGRYGAETRIRAIEAAPASAPTVSVGTASDGTLENGLEMPLTSETWSFIDSVSTRKTNFGTPQLIGTLERAAERVKQKWPDSTLLMGNMSKESGGNITQSVSHNSGRDADVAFYVVNGDADACTLDHFALMDRRGKQVNCDDVQQFDAARNWLFVKTLLLDPMAQVQWIFVSRPLRDLLLEQARNDGADDDLYRRAAAVLHQPGDSSPHADHFHIRVYCSRDDLLEGCINTGPIWDWVETYDADVRSRIAELATELRAEAPERRTYAIAKLLSLRARSAAPQIRELAKDSNPAVRKAAMDALSTLAPSELRPLLEAAAARTDDPADQRRAIHRLAYLGTTATVPILIRLLDSPERATRDALRQTLAYLTNTYIKPRPGKGTAVERLERQWKAWLHENASDSWAQWMRQGFEESGIRFRGQMMRNTSIPILIKATARSGHIGYNAQRVLSQLTGHKVDPTRRTGSDALSYWTKWWKKNHRAFGHRKARL